MKAVVSSWLQPLYLVFWLNCGASSWAVGPAMMSSPPSLMIHQNLALTPSCRLASAIGHPLTLVTVMWGL